MVHWGGSFVLRTVIPPSHSSKTMLFKQNHTCSPLNKFELNNLAFQEHLFWRHIQKQEQPKWKVGKTWLWWPFYHLCSLQTQCSKSRIVKTELCYSPRSKYIKNDPNSEESSLTSWEWLQRLFPVSGSTCCTWSPWWSLNQVKWKGEQNNPGRNIAQRAEVWVFMCTCNALKKTAAPA